MQLLVFFCLFSLIPFNVQAEEDNAPATKSSSLESLSIESSNRKISMLGNHAKAFDHNLVLYETLAQVNRDELSKLLEDSRAIVHGSVKDETLFAIGSRFTAIDPQEALTKSMELAEHEREPFLKGIFSEWCVLNLDEAIAATTKLNRRERLVALATVLSVRDDLTEAELNAIASELGHPDYASQIMSQSKTIEFADDPITAWSALVNDGLDDIAQLDTFVLVAETIIEEQGYDALFHLHEPFAREWRLPGETHIFDDEVLGVLVKNDPQNTWEYIRNGSSETSDQSMGKVQEQDQNSFSPREQAYMTDKVQHLLIPAWAKAFPETVLVEIEQIPYKLQPIACKHALAALVTTNPELTVELIPSLSLYGASDGETLQEVVRQWSVVDPVAAVDWVLSASEIENLSSNDLTKKSLLQTALEALVLEDPKRALEIAVLYENSEDMIISVLARSDIETAIEVLPLVSQSARTWAIRRLADAMALQGEVDRGMEFLHQYEDSSEEEVSWYWFFRSWADYNAVGLFDRLDQFEPKLRTAAARALGFRTAFGFRTIAGFSTEQIDYIHSIYDWNNPPE